MRLESPWILVSSEVDPGTSSLWILRDDCIMLLLLPLMLFSIVPGIEQTDKYVSNELI